MMRQLFVVFLVALIGAAPLFAQSESITESMTEEELEEFNQNQLTVDVGITTTFTGGFGFSLESYRRWTGRQGFERLSESQFYSLAGYPAEAQKAATYKTVGWTLAIGGGALSFGGIMWMMLGAYVDIDDPNWETKMTNALYGGMVLGLGGLIPLFIGSSRVRKNWSSVEQAQKVAEKYNRNLAKKIRGGE